jgi:integrase/recombinase XerC
VQKDFAHPGVTACHRLAPHIAVTTGLRIGEVVKLNIDKFRRLGNIADIVSTEVYKINIFGKGRKWRTVSFSGDLIIEILTYIQTERAYIEYYSKIRSQALLLNPLFVGSRKGRRISVRTLQRRFASACLQEGLSTIEDRLSYSKDSTGLLHSHPKTKVCPLFVFHDLRHTFSVWTYHSRKHFDPAPWLHIQRELGHADIRTTTNRYLKAVNEIEPMVSDGLIKYLNGKTWNKSVLAAV